MNFTDAVRESIGKFLEGKMNLEELTKISEGPVKYSPRFFDKLEEQLAEADDLPEDSDED
jgi:hypothetical protein